jgi:Mg2+-importing ATPase
LLPAELKAHFVSLFQTGWFVESLWTQTMVVYMLRTEKIPFMQSLPAWPFLFLTAGGILFGTILPYTLLGQKLGMTHLPLVYFIVVLIPTIIIYLTLAQFVKSKFIKRFGSLL